MTRRAAWVLVAACVWTLYVWITRMWNIAHDDHSFGFKAVHAVLAVISVGFGIAVGVIGWRALRSGAAARPADSGDSSDSAGHDRRAADAVQQHP